MAVSTKRTREEVLKLYEAYQGGDTLVAIAEREHCTRQWICQLFDLHDLPRRKVGTSSTQQRLEREQEAHTRRQEIIDLYKEHGTIEAVYEQVNLPRPLISAIVGTIPNRESFRRRGTYVTRTPESLLEDLQRAAKLKGEPLTIPAYRDAARELGLASLDTHVAMFGSWPDALSEAGIEGNEPRGARDDSISLEECVSAVALCWRSLGHRPSYEAYCRYAQDNDSPSGGSVRNKADSWNNAVELAHQRLKEELTNPDDHVILGL